MIHLFWSSSGSDLKEYTISLTHNIRRSVHAIRGLRNPKLAIVVMQLCLHQWVASLCCRMLKEAVIRMNSEKVDTAGLETVLQILQREESIIWFDEVSIGLCAIKIANGGQ